MPSFQRNSPKKDRNNRARGQQAILGNTEINVLKVHRMSTPGVVQDQERLAV